MLVLASVALPACVKLLVLPSWGSNAGWPADAARQGGPTARPARPCGDPHHPFALMRRSTAARTSTSTRTTCTATPLWLYTSTSTTTNPMPPVLSPLSLLSRAPTTAAVAACAAPWHAVGTLLSCPLCLLSLLGVAAQRSMPARPAPARRCWRRWRRGGPRWRAPPTTRPVDKAGGSEVCIVGPAVCPAAGAAAAVADATPASNPHPSTSSAACKLCLIPRCRHPQIASWPGDPWSAARAAVRAAAAGGGSNVEGGPGVFIYFLPLGATINRCWHGRGWAAGRAAACCPPLPTFVNLQLCSSLLAVCIPPSPFIRRWHGQGHQGGQLEPRLGRRVQHVLVLLRHRCRLCA